MLEESVSPKKYVDNKCCLSGWARWIRGDGVLEATFSALKEQFVQTLASSTYKLTN